MQRSVIVLKPRADVTRSPKQGYQWPHKKDMCPPKFKKKKKICQCRGTTTEESFLYAMRSQHLNPNLGEDINCSSFRFCP